MTKDNLIDCPPGEVGKKEMFACLYMAIEFV